jgi:hypothetical protein
VILPVEYVGSTPCCTETALRQFFRDVAESKRRGGQPAPTARTPARRARDIQQAQTKLAEMGA